MKLLKKFRKYAYEGGWEACPSAKGKRLLEKAGFGPVAKKVEKVVETPAPAPAPKKKKATRKKITD